MGHSHVLRFAPGSFTHSQKADLIFVEMWNYIPSVSNPAKRKQTLTAAEKLQRDHAYDTDKRKRKYQKQWEQDFDWLQYDQHGDEDDGKMFCWINEKLCPMGAARESNSFIQGCTSLRINCSSSQ